MYCIVIYYICRKRDICYTAVASKRLLSIHTSCIIYYYLIDLQKKYVYTNKNKRKQKQQRASKTFWKQANVTTKR